MNGSVVWRHRVLVAWLAGVLILGGIGWVARDSLASGLLAGEDFARETSGSGDTTNWRIVCATGDTTTTDGWWASLPDIDAVEFGEFVSTCYAARWQGVLAMPPEGISVAGSATPVASPVAMPLISPEFITTWEMGGQGNSLFGDSASRIRSDIVRAERFALPLTSIVLVVVTRNLGRAAIPLVAGAVVAIVSIGVMTLLAMIVPVPVFVVSVVTMLSLALGIDYALFWIIRSRNYMTSSSGTVPATRTILVAGTVVAGASMGLLAMPLAVFRVVLAGIVTVAVAAVLVATTLVPVLASRTGGQSPSRSQAVMLVPVMPAGGFRWRGWMTWLAMVAAVGVVAGLAGLAWQIGDMRTDVSIQAGPSAMTTSEYDRYIEENLIEVRLSSVDVMIPGDDDGWRADALMAFLGQDEDFAPIVLVGDDPAGGATVARAVMVRPPGSERAAMAIDRLGEAMEALPDDGGDITIGGPLVIYERVVTAIGERQLAAAAIALIVAGTLMTVLGGRPLVSLTALAGTVLSVSATLGVLVLVFQKAVGAAVTGVEPAPHIELWVPVVLFCVVLGMGIDYHTFLDDGYRVARAGGLTGRAGLAAGYRATAPVIAAASLAMVLVFGGFAFSGSVALRQLGVGLAVGIALDAFLVRLMLLPLMTLLLSPLVGCEDPPGMSVSKLEAPP